MKNMKDYQNLYFKCNISLLADVFEKFRSKNLNSCGWCVSHNLSALTVRLLQCLIFKKMSSKLYQMLTCICYLNKSMRCEVYYICKKCSKANNSYLKSYDLKNELKQFM